MTEQEIIARTKLVNAAREEFKEIWKTSLIPKLADFSADYESGKLLNIQHLCWAAFKAGKGLSI